MTARTDLLVDPHALASALAEEAGLPTDAPRTRLLDVRWSLAEPDGRPAYLEGHLPGAVYVDLESELSAHGPATAGRHPLPDGATLSAAARRWGLRPGDRVVAYDGGGNFAAARLWWVLRDAGFADVRILDGALPAWIAAGLPVETGPSETSSGSVTLVPGQLPRVALDQVLEFAAERVLLDVRAPERYSGEAEPIDPRAGHVPGARNLPTAGNIDTERRFLSTDRLRARFAQAGIDSEAGADRVAVYCGSGITASHTLFALALTGAEGALFPGSWSQWSNHPELPVATGPRP